MFHFADLKVDRTKIVKVNGQFPGIPDYLKSVVANQDILWYIVITPSLADETNHTATNPCRVNFMAAANKKSSIKKADGTEVCTLMMQNMGRQPSATPLPNLDDLRPCAYYVWGLGAQEFKIINSKDSNNYKDTTITFSEN